MTKYGLCRTCRFYKESITYEDGSGFGLCRRYPPIIFDAKNSIEGGWPEITHDDSCGEYKPDDKKLRGPILPIDPHER